MGAVAEVLDGLTALGSAEEEGVAAGGGLEGELIQGHGLAAGGDDAGTGGGGEAEGRDVDGGGLHEAVVIGDGADDDDGPLVALLEVGRDAGEGHGGAVHAGHEQAAEDNLVEAGVRATDKEAVELHQQLEVDIVALGRLAVGAPNVVPVEIDS